jgi:UDP-GlcNAc:undecaprenyl-phosphate GlcNAc-1-phosphate transferase
VFVTTYAAFAVALLLGIAAPWPISLLLARAKVLDVPNARSSHARPTIRGAGLAPLLAFVVGCLLCLPESAHGSLAALLVILGVSVAASAVGFGEDLTGIPVVVRAGLQLGIGLVGAFAAVYFAHAAWWLIVLFAVAIAGYINVTNFMDGVNGISGLHGAVVGGFFGVLGLVAGLPWLTSTGFILALAFVGFLPWNLSGRMFLGDVGSYLLGGGIAIIAVETTVHGVSPLVAIAPLVIYLGDSGVTLIRRVVGGQRWFEAHRTHTYQRLTDAGLRHVPVAIIVAAATLASSAAGLLAFDYPSSWPISLVIMIVVLLAYLALPAFVETIRRRRISPPRGPSR